MKKIIIAVIAAVILPAALFAGKVTADSRVSKVIVYNDRALITREGMFDLSAGENTLIFTNIPWGIDDNSVRVSLAEKGLKILSIETGQFFTEKPINTKIAELDDKILALQDATRTLEESAAVLKLKEDFLRQIKAGEASATVKDGQILKQFGVKDWKEMAEFIEASYTEIYKKKHDLEVEKRKLGKQLEVLQSQRNEISNTAEKTYKSIAVTVEAASKKSYGLFVSYIAGGINWRPLYDARGMFDEKKIEIASYGVISQSTGEDWNAVDLSLSTAKPSLGGRAPELIANYLSFAAPYLRDAYKRKSANAPASAKGVMAPESSLDDMSGMLAKDEEYARPEMESASVEAGATAVFYKIKKKADIPSDGRPHNVGIAVDEYDAEFEYEASPELSTVAYLKTSVKNGDNSLMQGPANVFLGNEYIGQTYLKQVLPSEKFDLYLGADEGIKIERKEIKTQDENTGFIITTTKRLTKAYRITVQNLKTKPVSLNLKERVPVSKDEKIKVELTKCEPAKTGEIKNGILNWKVSLKPGEKKEFYLEYKVEYPKDRQVYWQ